MATDEDHMELLKKWWAQRDPNVPNPDETGFTVPCDGNCGCEEPHSAHLAPDWEQHLDALIGVPEEEN